MTTKFVEKSAGIYAKYRSWPDKPFTT